MESTVAACEHAKGDYHGFEPFKLTNPFPAWKELREEAPVFYDDRIDHYVVSRYDDVRGVFSDWETFSSANAQAPVRPIGARAKQVMDDGDFSAYSGLSARTPPEHTRIREIATKAFTPRRYKALEPFIRDNVNTLVDAMIAKGQPADLLTDIAWDLPTVTIFTLIGVPTDRIEQVKEWAASRAAMTWGDLTEDEQVPHAHNLVAYWDYCRQLVADAKAAPGDNLVSDLVGFQAAGDDISDHEIASFLYSLLFAGHETTTTLISNTLRELLANDVYRRVVAHPKLIPGAIDEVLRVSGSIIAWRRVAERDGEIAGVAIPAGSKILLLMGAANRDPEVFPDPDLFDITRENARRHLSFGFGIHYCIGNQLAKLQTRIAVEEVARRLPTLAIAPDADIRFGDNLSFRVPTAVPAMWS
jgi:cytochrome P450